MQIHLRPELEALIRKDVERGSYETVDEFVERAVSLLHEQEAWLAEHRTEIKRQIATGYEAAQRGELIGAEEARSRLNQRKWTKFGEQPRG
jgi:Arc/MetJ-type ribon-helix-helix transcriptional regulator